MRTTKSQPWVNPALGARVARSSARVIASTGTTRCGSYVRTIRRARIVSLNSMRAPRSWNKPAPATAGPGVEPGAGAQLMPSSADDRRVGHGTGRIPVTFPAPSYSDVVDEPGPLALLPYPSEWEADVVLLDGATA